MYGIDRRNLKLHFLFEETLEIIIIFAIHLKIVYPIGKKLIRLMISLLETSSLRLVFIITKNNKYSFIYIKNFS